MALPRVNLPLITVRKHAANKHFPTLKILFISVKHIRSLSGGPTVVKCWQTLEMAIVGNVVHIGVCLLRVPLRASAKAACSHRGDDLDSVSSRKC